MKTIMVFKTSVTTQTDIAKLKPLLNRLFENKGHWNFDLEDRENILRVEGDIINTDQVINTLATSGYKCVELED